MRFSRIKGHLQKGRAAPGIGELPGERITSKVARFAGIRRALRKPSRQNRRRAIISGAAILWDIRFLPYYRRCVV